MNRGSRIAFLSKPFTETALAETVRQTLDRRPARG
jgi:FixJ family two-component response regulator